MTKIICSPGSYIQGNGELQNLGDYYSQIGTKGVYLIVDKFVNENYNAQIISSFEKNKITYVVKEFGGECCEEEIELHKAELGDYDAVIGIGGGKTLDTAKAVAFYSHLPVIIVPTIASSDAPCSRLSVLYTKNGEFSKYLPLPANPNIVIMDMDIIIKAPARYLMAGVGDALATYYEAAASVTSNAITMAGGNATKASFALAKLCKDILLEDGVKAKIALESGVSTFAVENIVEANTYLSGIGFESCGLAAAHAIHNGLTVIEETHNLLHGEKVAFGTLCQLVLENRPIDEIKEIIEFCKACGLPTTLKDLGIENASDDQLMEVAKLSCAEGETIYNMPFEVTPNNVFAALKMTSKLAENL